MNDYDKLIICNSCSPAWLLNAMPAWLMGWFLNFVNGAFKPACDKHDVAYYNGYTDKHKAIADKLFYRQMKAIVKKRITWRYRWLHYTKAWVFYRLVKRIGFTAFYYGESSQVLPSYIPTLSPAIREAKVQCVWLFNRWWTRDEAKRNGFLNRGQ